MPKVSINIIKDWFKNQSKPPQEQFWAWLDSFWHKDEPIPQSAVENLVTTLQKKADLVNGVVPEEQLPFSVVTSEVIALGKREITGNVLKLNVHSSGANVVRVKGKLITRSFENTWTFSEITGSGINVLRGYAVKSEDDFFMVESGEQAEITDPEIPADALEIFRLALSAAGIVQDPDAENGYKLRDEDPWRTVQILNAAPMNIVTATSPSTSFNIEVFTLAPKIAAIKTKVKKNTRDGLEITLYNNSDTPVLLMAGDYVEDLTYSSFPFADNYTLKPRSFAKFKRKENKYHELAGGSASFPEGAAPGDVLTEGTEGPEWSNRLTNVETNKQDKSMFSALMDKWIHYYDETTQKMQPILKFVSGVVNQLEFSGRIKADAIVLPANSNTPVANRLRSDGSDIYYANDSAVEHKLLQPPTATGDFSMFPKIMAFDGVGNTALVPSGTIDAMSMFFSWNVKYFFANYNLATYTSLRISTIQQAGHNAVADSTSPHIDYKSNGSTIAFVRGTLFIVRMDKNFITKRKFQIKSTVAGQRIVVGIAREYGLSAPTNIEPTSMGYCLCVAMLSTSSNLYFITAKGAGTNVATDTGWTNNPIYAYELTIMKLNPTTIRMSLMRIHKTTLATEVVTHDTTNFETNPPYVNQYPIIWCVDSANTSEVVVGDHGAMLLVEGFSL